MKLTRLAKRMEKMKLSPEILADKSNGDFSNMTVRRAIGGNSIDRLKAKAIARVLRIKLEELA